MILTACIAFGILFHALQTPVILSLESDYIEAKYNITKKKPDSGFALWCIKQYTIQPRLYNVIVNSFRILCYVFLLILPLTTPLPEMSGVFLILLIMMYSCLGNPYPIESQAQRFAENEIDELIDEDYRQQVLSSESLDAGLQRILSEIRNTDSPSEHRLRSFLWHSKLKGGSLGALAEEMINELGIDPP